MNRTRRIEIIPVQNGIEVRTETISQLDFPALNSLALRSLVSLFDEKERLFSRRVTLTEAGLRREGCSRKHTIVALLGLQRLADAGQSLPFDVVSIRDFILGDTRWVKSVGDLGLLTWLAAVCAPEHLRRLLGQFDFAGAVANYPDGLEARTTGLAWFLSGIAHARLADPSVSPELTDAAVGTYHLLQDNQGEHGIYGHAGSSKFPRDNVYRRCGSFSDQIYTIYALAKFAQAFDVDEPLVAALECANSICELQGNMGQWWFLYDKRACRVVNRYPVCSLHQDGTAPASLLALGEATGQDFLKSIHKGLSWTAGENELGIDLRSQDRSFVWDSIDRKAPMKKYWEAALSFMNVSRQTDSGTLSIGYDARPDHFGWLLYAFGGLGLQQIAKAATVR